MKLKKLSKKSSNNLKNLETKLLKTPILFNDFLRMLEECEDTFYQDPYLEFELLLSNGFALELEDDYVFLKTTKTKIEEQTFCIVDIETNGSSVKKGYQIIELGAVKIKNGEIINKFSSLAYAKDIPEYIQEVTNISPDMLVNAPRIEEVLKDFKLFLLDDVFVAHDIKFDYNFISDSFEKYSLGKLMNRKLCTIDLAKRTIQAQRYGLSYLKEFLKIDINNHHRAYYDALSTAYIFKESILRLNSKKISTIEELIKFSKSDNILEIKKEISNV